MKKHLLIYSLDICKNLKFKFDPEYIFVDYEVAIHLGIKKVFPCVKIQGYISFI